jgi:hypothetical protein
VIGSDGRQLWLLTLEGVDDEGPTLWEATQLMAELGDPLGLLEVQAARAEWLMASAESKGTVQASALAAVDALTLLLPRLLQDQAEEAALPMSLHLVAWQALCAAGDERAAALLAQARNALRLRAARITDPTVRRDYLQLPDHRLLLAD